MRGMGDAADEGAVAPFVRRSTLQQNVTKGRLFRGAAYFESPLVGMAVGARLPVSHAELLWGSSADFPRAQRAGVVEENSHGQTRASGRWFRRTQVSGRWALAGNTSCMSAFGDSRQRRGRVAICSLEYFVCSE